MDQNMLTSEDRYAYWIKRIGNGDYNAIPFIGNNPENGLTSFEALSIFYDRIPDIDKHKIVMDVYMHIRGTTQPMRKFVCNIMKFRPENYLSGFPEELKGQDIVTVYRGGSEPIEKASYSISWTINKDIAEFFYNRLMQYNKPAHLYSAIIGIDNIIAYTNERGEFEILQYRKVKDVQLIKESI